MTRAPAPDTATGGPSRLPAATACAAYALLMALAPRLLRDPDVYFHPTVGRWILVHGAVPSHDTFTHSMPGAPWNAHEWLAEIVFALAHASGGWLAVVALTAGATALGLYVLARHLTRHLPARHVVLLSALAWMLAAIHLNARPHALAFPCLALYLVELTSARDASRTPRVRALLVVFLWANLHASVILALVLAAALAAEAWLAATDATGRRVVVRGWGAHGLGAVAAASITPQGPKVLRLALQMESDPVALSFIHEWRPPEFTAAHPLWLFFLVLVVAGLAFRPRVPWVRLGLVVVLCFAAGRRVRYAEVLGVVTPILVASSLGAAIAARRGSLRALAGHPARADPPRASIAGSARIPSHRTSTVAGIALALAATLLAAVTGLARPDPRISPSRALAAAREAGITGPVLNSQSFGGFLIAEGVPTFIDGRIDLFGGAFFTAYMHAVADHDRLALKRVLARHAITWTLLAPTTPAVAELDTLPGWRRLYADQVAVVHVPGRAARTPAQP